MSLVWPKVMSYNHSYRLLSRATLEEEKQKKWKVAADFQAEGKDQRQELLEQGKDLQQTRYAPNQAESVLKQTRNEWRDSKRELQPFEEAERLVCLLCTKAESACWAYICIPSN